MGRSIALALIVVALSCSEAAMPPSAPASRDVSSDRAPPVAAPRGSAASAERGATFEAAVAERTEERATMVARQLERRDITDRRVLAAMTKIPRHVFVPEGLRDAAYEDRPLPIGYDATISQPYIVALMTELADVQPGERVLDVGTGSGYQAAILAELGAKVWAIEIVPELADSARARLQQLGFADVDVVQGDGWKGRPEHAPYDAIVVAAAPDELPRALVDQLADGGRLVIPVGGRFAQELRVVTRKGERTDEHIVAPVAFVPLVRGK